jgi:hypothetical protein
MDVSGREAVVVLAIVGGATFYFASVPINVWKTVDELLAIHKALDERGAKIEGEIDDLKKEVESLNRDV